ncbi:hypothetical protein J6590_080436 [Homalodisca vitripennis]|nr:hypothetical protein J6590_080436 [Homalodisca vitripennis]
MAALINSGGRWSVRYDILGASHVLHCELKGRNLDYPATNLPELTGVGKEPRKCLVVGFQQKLFMF